MQISLSYIITLLCCLPKCPILNFRGLEMWNWWYQFIISSIWYD